MAGAAVPPSSPANLAFNDTAPEAWFDDTRTKFVWTNDLPRGEQYRADLATAFSGLTATTTIKSTSFTFRANRRYVIRGSGRWTSSATGIGLLMDISDGTTAHVIYEGARSGTPHEQAAGEWRIVYGVDTTLTVSLRVAPIGAGNVTFNVGATQLGYLTIEDVGAN